MIPDSWPAPVRDGEIDLIFDAANDNDAASRLIGCIGYRRREHSQALLPDLLSRMREQRDAAENRAFKLACWLMVVGGAFGVLLVRELVRIGVLD